jgi:hypothetical protein
MNTRIFSVLAAVALSSAALPALARDTNDVAGATRPAVASPSGTTQSAQAMTPPSRGDAVSVSPYVSQTPSQWQRSDDDTVRGIPSVKVGPGPGYAWWKDR